METIAKPPPGYAGSARILVVDDEWKIRDSLARGLRKTQHWTVHVAANGSEAIAKLGEMPFDLLVLDWMLPDHDGLEILSYVRAQHLDASVLMLTARDGIADRVTGIDAGADDYLVKPFAFEEFVARCRAVLRRRSTPSRTILHCGDLEFDPRARTARRAGMKITLTPLESDLLEYLITRLDTVITREMLASDVWRSPLDAKLTNTIYIHIARLRQKIDSGRSTALIHTVPRFGYQCGINPPGDNPLDKEEGATP
jgi:DNA-binding response OmpR family regulator